MVFMSRSNACLRRCLVLLLLLACSAVAHAASLRIVPGLDEPLVATAPTGAAEDAALDAALQAYLERAARVGDFAEAARPLTAFLAAHPRSPWRLAVLTNLGMGYYRAGYFSRARGAWADAWQAGRDATGLEAKALADRAFGELARMHARIGDATALESLFAQAGARPVSGPATELVTGAKEGLWMFRNDWGTAYLCGPMALKNMLIALKADATAIAMLDKERSGPHGYTLAQVEALAQRADLAPRLVYRRPGAAVPVPSVIHLKLNHYAAIVGTDGDRYHLQDPTFASGDLWVSKAVIDAEASGYFLVPGRAASSADAAWRTASAAEARQVYGMGYTAQSQMGATTPDDKCSGRGMCVAGAKTMLVSLTLNDTPVGYLPAKGPSALIRLTYNQREAYQPANFSFFNVSPKWTLNVLSYIQDNPARPGIGVLRYVAGGGAVDYSWGYVYNTTTGQFSPERQGQAVLVRIPATGAATSYELRLPNGGKQVFARPDGASAALRRMFLTQIVDAQGNALTLNYDAQLRLTSLTDATGRNTTFDYEAASPLLVTRITDPFGRAATLAYDDRNRLASITDVLGLTSSFAYDDGGLVNAMTTPYGTSRFVYGSGPNNQRYLESTDPMGFTERLEFRHAAPGIRGTDPKVPPNISNAYFQYRNTFYWDKHLYPTTHTDYTRAEYTHWLHNGLNQTSPIVESVKKPLENRVFRTYAGQGATYYDGTNDKPTSIGRVLDDGSIQAWKYTYTPLGKPLTATDPVGRKTVFTYAANGIDLITVQQQTGNALETVAAFTYDTQHRELTHTDAAGQTTRYDYNAAGQLTRTRDALNQTTSYDYDALGRLTGVTNANGTMQESLSHDDFDRVASRTDSEGYTLRYSYDAFDRVTQILYPDGTTTEYDYDRLDLASVKDRLGRITRYAYDANRRLVSVTDPEDQVTHYDYYRNGVLASLTDPKGNITRWDIDIQSRPVAKHYADGTTERYAYEPSGGRLKTVTDALGQVRQFGYFADNRTASITYANTRQPTGNVALHYDPFFPLLTQMTDGIGTTAFRYHPAGATGALQLSSEDGPYGNDTVAYQYDALGRLASRSVDSAAESFAYDRLGRVIQHNSALGRFSRSYLGQTGQMTSQGNGMVGTQWTYHDNARDRRLLGIVNSGQARSFDFTTTSENHITAIREKIGNAVQRSWSYGYDAADRLTGAQASTGQNFNYAYDPADNLTVINGTAVSVNAANQIVTFGGTALTYDANGNLIEDGSKTYQWDAENRLVGIGYKNQPGNLTQMRYDGMGRRLAIADTTSLGAVETRYLWCGDRVCQRRNNGDVVTRRYFAEGFLIPQGGQALYYGADQIGSVRDLLAVQNGARVGSFDYDPYGKLIERNGRITSDVGYAGLLFHVQSGMLLANFRNYDPFISRWISKDPIGEVGGINLYAYVSSNPVSLIDPYGLFCVSPRARDAIANGFGTAAGAAASGYPLPGAAAVGVIAGTTTYVGGPIAGGFVAGVTQGAASGRSVGAAVAGGIGGLIAGADGGTLGAMFGGAYEGALAPQNAAVISGSWNDLAGPVARGVWGGLVSGLVTAASTKIIDFANKKLGDCHCGLDPSDGYAGKDPAGRAVPASGW